MTIEEKMFAQICFVVLMANGVGYMDKHPIYIDKKMGIIERGFEAYGTLDRSNQLKVIDYFRHWKIDLPEPIQQYEEDAAEVMPDILC